MADLAMLALSLIAVAAVFVSLRREDDEVDEQPEAGEIDRVHRDTVPIRRRPQLR
ncbi:hypothetical protein AB0I53_01115 [Saccharopolyspora sp. NPDC050389]|uniref:hypothetical protein n=1 Tax=Saccharopolyspora sp. NPDC050389 TaxID=3155516 RepID=UPI00340D7324